jgi:hypothetical protein
MTRIVYRLNDSAVRYLQRCSAKNTKKFFDKLKYNNRGQLWTEFFKGIMVLGIAGFMYIFFNQILQENLTPLVVSRGVYAPNAALLETLWGIVLVFVALAVMYALIEKGRKRERSYGIEY